MLSLEINNADSNEITQVVSGQSPSRTLKLRIIVVALLILLGTLISLRSVKKGDNNYLVPQINPIEKKIPQTSPFDKIFNLKAAAEVRLNLSSPGYRALDALKSLPWTYVAEPFRQQTLTLISVNVNDSKLLGLDDEAKHKIIWTLNYVNLLGPSVTFTIPKVGIIPCSIEIQSIDTKIAWTYVSKE